MLNADDQYTPLAINRLRQVVREHRPIAFWIGAGASRWAELPSWHDSARQMRKTFAKSHPGFPTEMAASYLKSKSYPALFQLCKEADTALFHRVLHEKFSSPNIGDVYLQFVEKIKRIAPTQIVTTNVDLCLEHRLGIDVIERSDLERCTSALISRTPFIGKLHGSISSIATTVFTTDEYRDLVSSQSYIAAVRSLFSIATVIFLGYGLQDDYVLNLLNADAEDHHVFGNGPHFLVTPSPGGPQGGVYRISYGTTLHPDHRAALTVLDIVEQSMTRDAVVVINTDMRAPETKEESAFYISDFKPSGTQLSGQVVDLGNEQHGPLKGMLGLGFVEGELPSTVTVAFHDLAVGLLCFDRVFLPLSSVGIFHLRASSVFWQLIGSGSIKFVDIVHEPFYLSEPESLIGGIGVARIQDPQHEKNRSPMSVVRRMLHPIPGREEEAEKQLESLETHIISFTGSETLGLANMVRDALLLPKVSKFLGFSDYAVPSKIPRWLAYPTLRLAHLVQTGLICDQLHIRASRVPFGGVSLLTAAFSVKPAEQTIYDCADFVLTGAYGSNLSGFIELNPHILLSIMQFRESQEGESLRREIRDRLETNDGSEFSAAIEGSLKRAIPSSVVQAARNKFSTLLRSLNGSTSASVLWTDSNTGDASLRLWRDRSRQLLLAHAKERGVKGDSICLCESGDPFRDCCLRPLKT